MRHVSMDEFAVATPLADHAPLLASDIPGGLQPRTLASLLTPTLLLASCGPGDPSAVGNPSADAASQRASVSGDATPTPTLGPLTRAQASRLLGQATMGASPADIISVQSLGMAKWVDQQIAMPRVISLWDWLVSKGYLDGPLASSGDLMDVALWHEAITADDQLRQRVGHSLLDIFVVSAENIQTTRGFNMAAYIDLLMDGAFGSFRQLLGNITANVSMASFMSFLNSDRADPSSGTHPDENFAREVMQLFTIGLYKLNPDGSRQLQSGVPIETYTQADISGLARVFTGWTWPQGDLSNPATYRLPVIQHNYASYETGAKTFLGTTIAAGTDAITCRDLALDTLCAHPNVGPFIGRQLIQRLVTSNPSPAYIGRVSAVFARDSKGVRGNLGAVIRAILLDPEARAGDAPSASGSSVSWGRLRTPTQRITNWARAFSATSPSDTWPIGNVSTPWVLLGQSPGHAPSVFNFFRPGYAPPGSPIATQGLVAPEMQITTEPTLFSYLNYIPRMISGNLWANDIRGDYSAMLALRGNAAAIINEINVTLAAGQLSLTTTAKLTAAISTISTATADGLKTQLYAAITLVMSCPEYLVQK